MPDFAHTLLDALSGYGQDKDVQLAREAGFDHHLVKPVDFPVLMNLFNDSMHEMQTEITKISLTNDSDSRQIA